MSGLAKQRKLLRLSLRELLLLVALFALAIASLKYANDLWLVLVAAIMMIALFVALIVAVVDRGPRQSIAIGFALTVLAYGLILTTGQQWTPGSSGNTEFDPWSGRLPTTRLLRYVHRAVESGGYYDNVTGKKVPDYDPTNDPMRTPMPGGGRFGPDFGPAASYRAIPLQKMFMPIGHCWWALILGYAGGHFARFVYWRRVAEQRSLAAESS